MYFISFAKAIEASISTLRTDTLSMLQPMGMPFSRQNSISSLNMDFEGKRICSVYPHSSSGHFPATLVY